MGQRGTAPGSAAATAAGVVKTVKRTGTETRTETVSASAAGAETRTGVNGQTGAIAETGETAQGMTTETGQGTGTTTVGTIGEEATTGAVVTGAGTEIIGGRHPPMTPSALKDAADSFLTSTDSVWSAASVRAFGVLVFAGMTGATVVVAGTEATCGLLTGKARLPRCVPNARRRRSSVSWSAL